ncbi:hypothetical protein QTL95_09325 [Rhizobium sp. S152]|uniref:Antitoxin VbhA domain-containing protein n=1 Tax=Halobaculum lipolyticum TaxID=3032001 RepID=A0ABD5W8J5_9EURY|nr:MULTISPECIES: hypothetical protein [Bacteria]MDM9626097.1 hypothetical protein [Rhizobium sp. S152]
MCKNEMRIHDTDERDRLYGNLVEATGENTKSGALDAAARYYLQMRGGSAAVPTGAVTELMRAAEERGSLTGAEIAEILTTDELRIRFETSWSVDSQ